MARKFQIGDIVEVIAGPTRYVKIGHKGKVTKYYSGYPCPYDVKRRNGSTGPFSAKELKLIKRKK